MFRPRGRTPSERSWAMDGPSARAVGQTGEPREPDEGGRTSGGGLSFGDFSLATQRKVTRPSPKGGRNPVEGSALVSCMAEPCHSHVGRHSPGNDVTDPLTLTLSRKGGGDQTEVSEAGGRNPHRGPRPRVLRGEAVPFTRGTTLHQAMPLPTPHPSPLSQGGRGWLPRTITLR